MAGWEGLCVAVFTGLSWGVEAKVLIRMAKQFLNRANVSARLQQVGSKTVAERVNRNRFFNVGSNTCLLESFGNPLGKQVVVPHHPGLRIYRESGGGENPVPGPALPGPWIFALQRTGQKDTLHFRGPVTGPQRLRLSQLFTQG